MKKLMMIFGLVALTVTGGILAQGTRAADVEERNARAEDILSRQAERTYDYGGEGSMPVYRIESMLRSLYGIYLFMERPPLELVGMFPDGAIRRKNDGLEIPVHVPRGQSLERTLELLCADSGGMLTWELLHDVLCIYPSRMPDEKISPLELAVTLDLQEASVWEAIKMVSQQINNALGPGSVDVMPLYSIPDMLDQGDPATRSPTVWGYQPPEWFTASKTLTLQLEDISAREALCAIFNASPHPVRARYTHPSASERPGMLRIIFFWRHYDPGPPMEDVDLLHWRRERYEAVGRDPAEASEELVQPVPFPSDQ